MQEPRINDNIIQLNIPVEVKRWNGRKIIIAPGDGNEQECVDDKIHPVTKRLAQAHRWLNMIESGEYPTVARLAEGLNLDPSNLMKVLKMTTLSPKIQEKIIAGDVLGKVFDYF